MNIRIVYFVALAAVFTACSSTPNRNPSLEQARAHFTAAQSDPQVAALAGDELQRAGESLGVAEQAWNKHDKPVVVDHLAYMTDQRVTIARETASSRASQAITANAAAERDRMRLAMRTREADFAQQQLALSQQSNAVKNAELARADANAERDQLRLTARSNEADAAQQQLALSQQSNAQKTNQLAEANANAVLDQARNARSEARADDLAAQLKDLNAKKTDRGMVVTFGDVMFDTGKSQLLRGSRRDMAKLAAFFKRNPERKASIEGYTDSVGTESNNFSLSERRADAVLSALTNLGVSASQLTAHGHGEENPVADNSTSAGRQMNRRVEIVFPTQGNEVASQ